jgi:hypothetical protein
LRQKALKIATKIRIGESIACGLKLWIAPAQAKFWRLRRGAIEMRRKY